MNITGIYIRTVDLTASSLFSTDIPSLITSTSSRLELSSPADFTAAIVNFIQDLSLCPGSDRQELAFIVGVPLMDALATARDPGLVAAAAAAAPAAAFRHQRDWMLEFGSMVIQRLSTRDPVAVLRGRCSLRDLDLDSTVVYTPVTAGLRLAAPWLPAVMRLQAAHRVERRPGPLDAIPALHAAAAGGHSELLERMLAGVAGAAPTFGFASRRLGAPFTPLDVAVLCGAESSIGACAKRWPESLNRSLMLAADRTVSEQITDILCKLARPADLCNDARGGGVLGAAARANNDVMIRSITKCMGLTQQQATDALLVAARSGSDRAVAALLAAGAPATLGAALETAYSACAADEVRQGALKCCALLLDAAGYTENDLVNHDLIIDDLDSRHLTGSVCLDNSIESPVTVDHDQVTVERMLVAACAGAVPNHVALFAAKVGAGEAGPRAAAAAIRGSVAQPNLAVAYADCIAHLVDRQIVTPEAVAGSSTLLEMAQRAGSRKCVEGLLVGGNWNQRGQKINAMELI